jgi:hypothetical protein
MDKMNSYFGHIVVERLKLTSFDDGLTNFVTDNNDKLNSYTNANKKFINKIVDIKNDKIKKSIMELNKFFKGK